MIPLAKIVRVEVDVAVRRIPLQAVVSPGVGTGLQVSKGCQFYPDGSIFWTRVDGLTRSTFPTHQNLLKFNTGRDHYLYPSHEFDGVGRVI